MGTSESVRSMQRRLHCSGRQLAPAGESVGACVVDSRGCPTPPVHGLDRTTRRSVDWARGHRNPFGIVARQEIVTGAQ
jgi:hypothetical protein